MKTPLRWVGGKVRLSKEIVQIMPEHKCYVEVFGGGLSTLFSKHKATQEVVNDINSELINFWKVIQIDFDNFKNKCNYLIPSREIFMEYKLQNVSELTDLDRAVRFFYLNRTCFGGDMNNPRFGTSNSRRNRLCSLTDDFQGFMTPIYERLKDVTIENLDWKNCIVKYDQRKTSKEAQEVLFYLDPPYLNQYGYESEFTIEDHIKLADTLSNINGKFILSINQDTQITELYKGYYFIDKELKCTLNKDSDKVSSRKEYIITNFEVKQ